MTMQMRLPQASQPQFGGMRLRFQQQESGQKHYQMEIFESRHPNIKRDALWVDVVDPKLNSLIEIKLKNKQVGELSDLLQAGKVQTLLDKFPTTLGEILQSSKTQMTDAKIHTGEFQLPKRFQEKLAKFYFERHRHRILLHFADALNQVPTHLVDIKAFYKKMGLFPAIYEGRKLFIDGGPYELPELKQ